MRGDVSLCSGWHYSLSSQTKTVTPHLRKWAESARRALPVWNSFNANFQERCGVYIWLALPAFDRCRVKHGMTFFSIFHHYLLRTLKWTGCYFFKSFFLNKLKIPAVINIKNKRESLLSRYIAICRQINIKTVIKNGLMIKFFKSITKPDLRKSGLYIFVFWI